MSDDGMPVYRLRVSEDVPTRYLRLEGVKVERTHYPLVPAQDLPELLLHPGERHMQVPSAPAGHSVQIIGDVHNGVAVHGTLDELHAAFSSVVSSIEEMRKTTPPAKDRFWIMLADDESQPESIRDAGWWAVVDEEAGGVVAYAPTADAAKIIRDRLAAS